MLLNIPDNFKPSHSLQKTYKGTVVSNDDPKQLGRIKVTIPHFLEGGVDELPYMYPQPQSNMGGRADLGSFSVPEVGSDVLVKFLYDDIYSGFYSSAWTNSSTKQGIYNEDYPESYGFRDNQNTRLKIDRGKKLTEFHHSSGAQVLFDNDGNITLRTDASIIFESKDGLTNLAFNLQDGNVNFNSKEANELSGNEAKISSTVLNVDVKEVNETVDGAKNSTIIAGSKIKIGGSQSTSVASNDNKAVAGDSSELISGAVEKTYGTGYTCTLALGDWVEDLISGSKDLTLTSGDYNITQALGNFTHDLVSGKYDINVTTGDIELTTSSGNVTVKTTAGSANFETDAGDVTVKSGVGNATVESSATSTLKGLTQVLGSGGHPLVFGDTLNTGLVTQFLSVIGSGIVPGGPVENAASLAIIKAQAITAQATLATMNSLKSSTD